MPGVVIWCGTVSEYQLNEQRRAWRYIEAYAEIDFHRGTLKGMEIHRGEPGVNAEAVVARLPVPKYDDTAGPAVEAEQERGRAFIERKDS